MTVIERIQGAVKFFDSNKGYGFVRRKGATDVFIHANALKKAGLEALNKGDKIEFDVVPNETGKGCPRAANIVRLTA